MNILLRLAQAAGLSLALTAAAFADEPLKIATSAGPVGQLASFAAKLAKERGQDVKIVELSDWVALNEVVKNTSIHPGIQLAAGQAVHRREDSGVHSRRVQ